jgi:hypothetical protein
MSVKYTLKEAAEIIELTTEDLKTAIKDKKLKAEKEKLSGKQFKYIIAREELVEYGKIIGIKLIFPGEPRKEAQDEKKELSDLKLRESLKRIEDLEKEVDTYKELKKSEEYLKKELTKANNDFNEQAKEYDDLFKDYEKLEQDKHEQDKLISEAEQALLDMVEQYKELAEDIYKRDKKVTELLLEIEEIKKHGSDERSNVSSNVSNEDLKNEQDKYKSLEENYTVVLLENGKLKRDLQEVQRKLTSSETGDSGEDLYEEIIREKEAIQKELNERLRQIASITAVHNQKLMEETNKYEEVKKHYDNITKEKELLEKELGEKSRQIASITNIYKEIEKLQNELKTSKEHVASLEKQLKQSKKR